MFITLNRMVSMGPQIISMLVTKVPNTPISTRVAAIPVARLNPRNITALVPSRRMALPVPSLETTTPVLANTKMDPAPPASTKMAVPVSQKMDTILAPVPVISPRMVAPVVAVNIGNLAVLIQRTSIILLPRTGQKIAVRGKVRSIATNPRTNQRRAVQVHPKKSLEKVPRMETSTRRDIGKKISIEVRNRKVTDLKTVAQRRTETAKSLVTKVQLRILNTLTSDPLEGHWK